MKKILSLVLALSVTGCAADPAEVARYYNSIDKINQTIADSIDKQVAENRANRTRLMVDYTNAMTKAARTKSPTDDVIIAFAWGYQSAGRDEIKPPDMVQPKAPVTDVDRVKAWTPLLAMAVPFIYPLAYGWASSEATYSVGGNGRLNINSQNPGSGNTIGGNQTINHDPENESCYQCDLPEEVEGAEIDTVDSCLLNPPAGYNPAGDPLWTPGCSCHSHFILEDC